MKSKATINYRVDVAIAVAFVLAAVSGIVLVFAPSGFQGGRNPNYGRTILFLSTHAWGELHTYGSIAMIGGVLAHLVLHWRWMVCMTRTLFGKRSAVAVDPVEPCGPSCESIVAS